MNTIPTIKRSITSFSNINIHITVKTSTIIIFRNVNRGSGFKGVKLAHVERNLKPLISAGWEWTPSTEPVLTGRVCELCSPVGFAAGLHSADSGWGLGPGMCERLRKTRREHSDTNLVYRVRLKVRFYHFRLFILTIIFIHTKGC